MRKTVWILNQYAELDGYRHLELAGEFQKLGANAIVITSSYSHFHHKYNTGEIYRELQFDSGARYIWLRTSPPYTNNGINRILNMLDFTRMVRKYAPIIWEKYGKPDAVLASSPHPLVWESAHFISKRTGARIICEVRDFWPLSMIQVSGSSNSSPAVRFFGAVEKRAYRRAAAIATTTPYGYKYISGELGVPREKVHWLPNGMNTHEIDRALGGENPVILPPELDEYLTNNWCAVYTGAFVDSECIFFMLSVAKAFQDAGDARVKFAFIGNGHNLDGMHSYIKEHGLTNVRVFPRFSRAEVMLSLRKGGACIAAVNDYPLYQLGLSMNKLSDYLYSGTPTVFACNVPNVVQDAGGIVTPCHDVDAYRNALIRVFEMTDAEKATMAAKGREVILDEYDYSAIAEKYWKILF